MRKLIVVFLCISSSLFARETNICLEVSGTVMEASSKLSDASVSVFKGGSYQSSHSCSAFGDFTLQFETGNNYEIVIAKDGFFSQKIDINTQSFDAEVDFISYTFVIELFRQLSGLDGSIFDTPLAGLKYNPQTNTIEKILEKETLKRFDAFIASYEVAKKKVYDADIASADAAFLAHNYKEAKVHYNKAIAWNLNSYYPDFQLEMIDRIIAQDIRIQERYERKITKADRYYDAKAYKKARKYYQRALRIKQDEYPQNRLKSISEGISLKDIYGKH